MVTEQSRDIQRREGNGLPGSAACPAQRCPPARTASVLETEIKIREGFKAPPGWMLMFGAILAVCAGMVNVVCLLEVNSVVSHMTGHLTAIGLRLEGVRLQTVYVPGDVPKLIHSTLTSENREEHGQGIVKALFILISFMFGSFLCGLVIPKNAIYFGGKSFYGIALIGNSVLLVAAAFLGQAKFELAAACSAACGSGLQNAMCTMHLGTVVRTTHVTGTSTDIGSTLGRAAMILLRKGCNRRRLAFTEQVQVEVDLLKVRVLVTLFISFGFGCYLGALFFSRFGIWTLLVPASITGSAGILYFFFRETLKRQIKKWRARRIAAEMELVNEIRREHEEDGPLHRGSPISSGSESANSDDPLDSDEAVDDALTRLHDLQEAVCDMAKEQGEQSDHRGRIASS